jgi:hypothetical protein
MVDGIDFDSARNIIAQAKDLRVITWESNGKVRYGLVAVGESDSKFIVDETFVAFINRTKQGAKVDLAGLKFGENAVLRTITIQGERKFAVDIVEA